MSSDQSMPLSEVWAARYDDRDDEELACQLWARNLARREKAMAHPFKNFPMADEMAEPGDKRTPAAESTHPR